MFARGYVDLCQYVLTYFHDFYDCYSYKYNTTRNFVCLFFFSFQVHERTFKIITHYSSIGKTMQQNGQSKTQSVQHLPLPPYLLASPPLSLVYPCVGMCLLLFLFQIEFVKVPGAENFSVIVSYCLIIHQNAPTQFPSSLDELKFTCNLQRTY